MKPAAQEFTIILVITMNTNYNCGKRIKELRQERGLSQEHLALSADITPAYLGLLERGKRNATVLTIERICMALDITLAEFFAPTKATTTTEDEIGKQILYQLSGLSDEDKQLFLQLIKDAVRIRQSGKNAK